MLAFALGTLPNLLAFGWFAGQLKTLLQNRRLRLAAGLSVCGLGTVAALPRRRDALRLRPSENAA